MAGWGAALRRSGLARAPIGGTVRDAIEGFAQNFIQEIASTRRGDIVRLIVAEGPRFPAIADFYYREVVSRGRAIPVTMGIHHGVNSNYYGLSFFSAD